VSCQHHTEDIVHLFDGGDVVFGSWFDALFHSCMLLCCRMGSDVRRSYVHAWKQRPRFEILCPVCCIRRMNETICFV